jgi:hypothetical protein
VYYYYKKLQVLNLVQLKKLLRTGICIEKKKKERKKERKKKEEKKKTELMSI